MKFLLMSYITEEDIYDGDVGSAGRGSVRGERGRRKRGGRG